MDAESVQKNLDNFDNSDNHNFYNDEINHKYYLCEIFKHNP